MISIGNAGKLIVTRIYGHIFVIGDFCRDYRNPPLVANGGVSHFILMQFKCSDSNLQNGKPMLCCSV